jgi:nucleoside-diphosphate-sugar epimerase
MVHSACVYGPGQHLRDAIPVFVKAALSGEDPTIFGEGASVRDDVYVGDLADVLVEAALRGSTGSFHAGGERARTIFEVAELCCEAVARVKGDRARVPRRDAGKPPKWWLDQRFDGSSTRETFGYVPTRMLEGLEAEVRWVMAGAPRESEQFAIARPGGGPA